MDGFRSGSADRAGASTLGEAVLREIYHSVNDAIFVHDAETGEILDVNEAMCEMYGYSRTAARTLSIADLSSGVPPYTQEHAIEYVHEAAEGNPQVFDWQAEDSDGNHFWVEVSMRRAVVDGRTLVLVIVRDITERKRREQELKAAQRRFDAVFNNPIAFIGLLDPDGTVVDINDTALEFVDQSADEVIGTPFPETPWWNHSSTLQADLRSWIERAAAGELVRYEAEHHSPDGERVTIDGVLHPIRDGDTVVSLLAAGRDISERKARERERHRQNDRLEEFASIVSHDLRNPLNVAEGHLELARDAGDCDHLDAAADAHERMATLIDDLLALARQGEAAVEPSTVDLASLADLSWRHVETGTATLVTDTARTIRADSSRLAQLFENLFRNSVEHGSPNSPATPDDAADHGSTDGHPDAEGGESPGDGLTVRVGDLDGGFYVADDGSGIAPDNRERIFEAGVSTTAYGTGLGLRIVSEIAEAHGWSIRAVESDAGGARFELTNVDIVG
ncbi:MAG: PAS domain S-box protein [Haloplanus sp.]